MDALENGAIANQDEKRQVGHYWLRQPSLAPETSIAQKIESDIDAIEGFAKAVLSGEIKTPSGDQFTDVLWIGIGGSGLGPLLMIRSLQASGVGLNFHFIDNVDSHGISQTLTNIEDKLNTTLFVTVSKSGTTPEPLIATEQARTRLENTGASWPDQAVAITMHQSVLDIQASTEGWLRRFDMSDWVGGRTSITSVVGLLPGALIGVDIREFLSGASQMDERTRIHDLRQNPAALLSAAWFLSSNVQGSKDMVVLPYNDRLEVFSRYLQQLVMESLGKRTDRDGNVVNQGLSVYGNKGSTDQHAYVQQLRDGLDNFFVTFIEVLQDSVEIHPINNKRPGDYLSGFLQGTRSALTEGGRQSINITLGDFNERTLGALIALFERSVGLYGEIININSYHQPGVEAGKLAAAEILKLQKSIENLLSDTVPRSVEEICKIIGTDRSESVYLIIRHLIFNDKSYLIQGSLGNPASVRVSRINDS